MPIIFVLCAVGAFAIAARLFDVWVMLAIGVLGFALRLLTTRWRPFVLGLVLGDLLEKRCGAASCSPTATSRPFSPADFGLPHALLVLIVLSRFMRWRPRANRACNEVIAPMPFPQQCEYAAKLGYDGLEIAPYTLSDEPHRLGSAQIAAARAAAEDAGVAVTGLHWLLISPGLSISSKDENVRKRTIDVMLALLIDQCAELGGRYLVRLAAPAARRPGETRAAALARARDSFAAIAERAQKAEVVYCIEPLSSEQTPLINTLDEAARMVAEIGSPAVRSMLDCSSAGRMEKSRSTRSSSAGCRRA